jgi:transketolase
MRDAVIQALSELAADDPGLMLLTGDLGFRVLDDFRERFPDRFLNAGVAEQNMTAVACGMAMAGARAYTYSIGNFPTMRCLEQLRDDVCYHYADVTVIAVGGGFSYGQVGATHHATEDLAILRTLPQMTVVAPSDPWQAHALVHQMHARGGPQYLRVDKSSAGLEPGPVELGRVRQVRPGSDAVIFAIGGVLGEAVAASDALAGQGLSVRVVDVHTLKPFDAEAICEAADACRIVLTLEEHTIAGGLGGAVAEACLAGGAKVDRFIRLGLRDDAPTAVGDQAYLRALHGLDRAAVARAVQEALELA